MRAAEHGAQGKLMANVEIPSLRCVDGLSAPHRRIDVVKNLFVGEASRLPFIIHHSFNTKTGLNAKAFSPLYGRREWVRRLFHHSNMYDKFRVFSEKAIISRSLRRESRGSGSA